MRECSIIQRVASSGAEALSLLFDPGTDIAYVGITPFALGLRLGIPVHIIGIAQRLGSGHGVVLRSGRSTQGQIVLATVAGSTGHQIAAEWAKGEGLDVRFIFLSPHQQLLAYRQGYVDGIACWEPFITQAVKDRGTRVYDATSVDYPVFNVLCATTSALRDKGPLVARFIDAHIAASSAIVSGEFRRDLGGLPSLYSRGITPDEYAAILQSGYLWQTAPLTKEDESVLGVAFDAAWAFLDRVGFTMDKRTERNLFVKPSDQDMGAADLMVAHTDSLMCAAYHLAITRRDFEKAGFQVVPQPHLRGQRIALLSEESRSHIVALDTLTSTKPLFAILGCRQKAESILRRFYEQYSGESTANTKTGSEEIIEFLHHHGIFSKHAVYAAAQWIRVVGNWANHNLRPEDESQEELALKGRECVEHLLTLLEWSEGDAKKLIAQFRSCRHCRKRLLRGDKCCPHCGTLQDRLCPQCSADLETSWRFCPKCGYTFKSDRQQAIK